MSTSEEKRLTRRRVIDAEDNIDFGQTDQVCQRKQKATTMDLFLKSLKFFSFVFLVIGTASVLMETLLGINRIFLYFLVGLGVSCLASYYKFMVWLNPDFHPACDCAQPESFIPSTQDMMDGVFTVLGHKKSALLFNVPNTFWGVLFYISMIFLNILNFPGVYTLTLLATLASCAGSVYLWYTMVCEVKSVCVICSSIHAISFLTLVSFFV